VPCEAEKEFAFPRFDILMVYALKAYSNRAVPDSPSLADKAVLLTFLNKNRFRTDNYSG
jgi:hypothetical protein